MANIRPTNTDSTNKSFNPADFNFAESNWSDVVRLRFEDQVQILKFCDVATGNVKDDDHYWAISPVSKLATYVASDVSNDTDIPLADASLCRRGTILDIEASSGTFVSRYCTSVDYATNTVTVNAAVTVDAGWRVVILGEKQVVGDDPDNTPVEEVTSAYNSFQEFNPKDIIAEATKGKRQKYGWTDEQAVLVGLARRHAWQLGRQLYFGTRVQGNASTPGEMGGIKYLVSTYGNTDGDGVVNVGGTLSHSALMDYLTARMAKGAFLNRRNVLFTDPYGAKCIEQLRKLNSNVMDTWNVEQTNYKEIGIMPTRFLLVIDPMLIEWGKTGSTRTQTATMVFVSLTDAAGNNNLKLIYDNDRANDITRVFRFKTHASAETLEMLTNCTFELGEPDSHLFLYGITGAAADA